MSDFVQTMKDWQEMFILVVAIIGIVSGVIWKLLEFGWI